MTLDSHQRNTIKLSRQPSSLYNRIHTTRLPRLENHLHMDSEKTSVVQDSNHVEIGWNEEKWGTDRKLSRAAEDRAVKEHDMTVREAIHAYPAAIFWCLVISTCVIMEGYVDVSNLRLVRHTFTTSTSIPYQSVMDFGRTNKST